jgi:hypothetical protein
MTELTMTLAEAVQAGHIVMLPHELSVDDHPGSTGPTAYIAAEPLTLSDEAGNARDVGAGDVLSASEIRASGTALHGLLSRHRVFPVPADRGVVGLVAALLGASVDSAEDAAA